MDTGRRGFLKGIAATGSVALGGPKLQAAQGTSELTWLSAAQIRKMIGARELSALEVTRHFLARIERLEPLLHAFLHIDGEGALAAARRVDADLASGKQLGPLAGVPIALKDQLLVKDMPATAGSLIFARFRPSFDGTIAERLRAAGAIIVGKTNMPEFAAWPRTKSYVGGETVNPWDTTRIAGASSGGSSTAVAAGMVPVAIGTDGGGSVRIPSALCGLYGLFPTIGRVPDFGGWHFGNMGSAGPMARTAEDVALIQQVIAGPDRRIPSSLPEAAPDVLTSLNDGIAGLRVAWSPDHGRGSVDSMVAETAKSTLAVLANAGARIDEITDRIDHPWGDGTFLTAAQEAAARGDYRLLPEGDIPDIPELEAMLQANSKVAGATAFVMPGFADLLEKNAGLLTPPQQLASKMPRSPELVGPVPTPEELRGQMQRIFARFDVLCSPTMAVVAPVAKPDWASPYPDMFMGTNLTFIANITACPAITVPCGFARDLPVGFQVIGRPGDEKTVLRVAQAIDKAMPLALRPPL